MSLHEKNRLQEISRLNLKSIDEVHSFSGTKTVIEVEEKVIVMPQNYSGHMLIHVSRQLNGKIVYVKGTWTFKPLRVVVL